MYVCVYACMFMFTFSVCMFVYGLCNVCLCVAWLVCLMVGVSVVSGLCAWFCMVRACVCLFFANLMSMTCVLGSHGSCIALHGLGLCVGMFCVCVLHAL